MDVTDSEGFGQLIDDVAEHYGRLDVLVNNAGITRDGLLMRMSDEDWAKVIAVNLTSAFIGSRAAARHMVRQRGGSIVNISSFAGVAGNPGQANYSASKAGLIGATKALAREVASRNILVNAVAPGFIETEMTRDLDKTQQLEMVPLGRFGTCEEVAAAVRFLCSDQAGYITGQVIAVNGGIYM